jgi:hypothetical protein
MSVTIPDGVTGIEGYTFYGCTGLTSITIPDSVASIGDGAFSSCTGLTSVTIPANVTNIERYAFSGCTGLTSVTIPNISTLESLFPDSALLRSVTFADGTVEIGDEMLSGNASLISVTIPDSVTYIGSSAFQGCTGLAIVTLGNGVTSIGESLFQGCTGLISVTIGYGVTSIENSAFQNCTSLTSITVDSANPFYMSNDGVLFNKSQTTLIRYPMGKTGSYTIPSSVTTIGNYAFQSCASLTSLTIGNNVTNIELYPFSYCSNLATIYFKGNTPLLVDDGTDSPLFTSTNTLVYYVLGTVGWTSTFGGLNTWALGPPTVTQPLSGIITNVGENAVFSVAAVSSIPLALSYQWQRNGVTIVGATGAALSLTNVQSTDVGNYKVVVTNEYGSVTSTAALTLSQGNLYTQAQYDTALQAGLNAGLAVGMATGRTQVTDSPNSYGLYSLAQVQALHVGTPLLAKDPVSGKFKLTIGAKKSADLTIYTALPFSAGDATINALGEMEFQFTSPDNAAFFRLESN